MPDNRWRNRIVEYRPDCPVSELLDNKGNWRTHPQAQRAGLVAILDTVGKADVLKAYYSQKFGGLTLYDGHLRKHIGPDETWPVVISDLTDEEANLVIATLDPLAAMAEADASKVQALLDGLGEQDAAVQAVLDSLAGKEWQVDYEQEWQGMPEFENEDNFGAVASVKVHFATEEAVREFSERIGQAVTVKSKYIWYPKQERENLKAYACKDES